MVGKGVLSWAVSRRTNDKPPAINILLAINWSWICRAEESQMVLIWPAVITSFKFLK